MHDASKRLASSSSEWADIRVKALAYVRTTLDCIYGVDPSKIADIIRNALDDAESYID